MSQVCSGEMKPDLAGKIDIKSFSREFASVAPS